MKVPKKDGERVDEFIMKGKATTVSNFGEQLEHDFDTMIFQFNLMAICTNLYDLTRMKL